MRFDPTNPQKVPAVVPSPARPARKRGQQIIPPPPVQPAKAANMIDLNSVVFEKPAAAQIIPIVPMKREVGPAWRRLIVP
jgi:hypothetical protein